MKIFDKLQYISLYILGFLIIGVTSLISGGFSIDKLQSATYYIDNILTYLAIICIIVATLLKIIDNFKLTNASYKEADKSIDDFANSKEYIPSIFSRYTDYANNKRKINQHIGNIKYAMYKLEKKSKDKDFYVWNHGTVEEKNNNKYCYKRKILEEKLSQDWIDKNLPVTTIKYDKITSGLILGGFFSKYENNLVNEFVTKHKTSKVIKDKIPTMILSFGVSCFVSALAVDYFFNSAALTSILVKCMSLLWNTFTTIRYANDWTIQITLKDIRWRKGIISEYKKWLTQVAEEKPKEVELND